MFYNLGDCDHLSHRVPHATQSHVLDFGLLKLFENIADVGLDLGASIDANNVVRYLFAFNGGLDYLFVFLHDDVLIQIITE